VATTSQEEEEEEEEGAVAIAVLGPCRGTVCQMMAGIWSADAKVETPAEALGPCIFITNTNTRVLIPGTNYSFYSRFYSVYQSTIAS
jgi:hypothetical protein